MPKKVRIIDKAIIDFDNVLVYLKELDDYFNETSKMLNQKKVAFQNKYSISYQLMKILDEIYAKEPKARKEYVESIQDTIVADDIALKDIIKVTITDENLIRFLMKKGYEDDQYSPIVAKRKFKSIQNQEMIYIRAILSNAIIIFEQYFANNYETLVLHQPKAYFENKQIPISEILENDINQILKKSVAKEVESNMFDSLKALDRIKEKSGIDVDRHIKIRKQFEEVYYRRNAYVHTGGNANATYLDKVDSKYKQGIKLNSPLICDEIYLESVIATVYKIVSSLHFELLQVLEATQDDYIPLSELGFDFLKSEKYGVAEYIYGLLRKEKSFEFANKAVYEINYINALKLQGKNVTSLINRFDVSIATDEFKIAKNCLLDNHEAVYEQLTNTYPESFDATAIREWPIFKTFRESEYYNKFIAKHKDDFDMFLFEDDSPKEEKDPCETDN